MNIKVLGSGCKSCKKLYDNVNKAVKDLGLNCEVAYITDFQEIANSGVMSMPALLIGEEVVSYGKVLKPKEIIKILQSE